MLDWFEDELVSHGHQVEWECRDETPAEVPAVVSTLQRVLSEWLVLDAPAGSLCELDVTASLRPSSKVTSALASCATDRPPRHRRLPGVDPYSTGSGLVGLRERVELTNGRFSAGEVGDHWVVEAQLPAHAVRV